MVKELTFRKLITCIENSLPVNKLADMINRPNAKWIAPRGTALESFIKVYNVFWTFSGGPFGNDFVRFGGDFWGRF